MKYLGNACSGVRSFSGDSGARREGEKTRLSKCSLTRSILWRKSATGWGVSHPASNEAAANRASSFRRVINLGTLASGDHRQQLARMQQHQHDVNHDKHRDED